jgi:protoheme IX farnesyltransferase
MTATTQTLRGVAAPWRALIELTKPRLSSLVLFTALVGYLAGTRGHVNAVRLLHVMIGTALVAGGANALNQIVERDSDGRMLRTRNRPLPSGRVETGEAVRFAALVSTVGLAELLFGVNLITAFLGAVALALYVFVYTPLKKVTVHNTLIGAVVGALPPLMGWTAATGRFDRGGWALFAILFVWQLPHFFSIAWLYREDYARGGYRMLANVDPSGRITRLQVFLLALLLVPVSLLPAVYGMAGRGYLVAALAIGVAFCAACAWRVRSGSLDPAARLSFRASLAYLPLVLAALLLDKI